MMLCAKALWWDSAARRFRNVGDVYRPASHLLTVGLIGYAVARRVFGTRVRVRRLEHAIYKPWAHGIIRWIWGD